MKKILSLALLLSLPMGTFAAYDPYDWGYTGLDEGESESEELSEEVEAVDGKPVKVKADKVKKEKSAKKPKQEKKKDASKEKKSKDKKSKKDKKDKKSKKDKKTRASKSKDEKSADKKK